MLTNELAGYMAGGLYNAFSADVLNAADLFKSPPGTPICSTAYNLALTGMMDCCC